MVCCVGKEGSAGYSGEVSGMGEVGAVLRRDVSAMINRVVKIYCRHAGQAFIRGNQRSSLVMHVRVAFSETVSQLTQGQRLQGHVPEL